MDEMRELVDFCVSRLRGRGECVEGVEQVMCYCEVPRSVVTLARRKDSEKLDAIISDAGWENRFTISDIDTVLAEGITLSRFDGEIVLDNINPVAVVAWKSKKSKVLLLYPRETLNKLKEYIEKSGRKR